MNKSELIEKIAATSSLTKTSIEETINNAIEAIKRAVKKGDDVTLVGFGTFTRSKRKSRFGRNPKTGEKIKIPAATVPKFKPGKEFKESVQ